MKLWPFGRPTETRANATDAYVDRMLEEAGNACDADALSTASIEHAAGTLARSLAAVEVRGNAAVTSALTPSRMAAIGRGLIRAGQVMLVIDVDPERGVVLYPASSWDPAGGYRPESWTFRAVLSGPSRSETVNVPYAGVLLFQHGSDPGSPWKGRGPANYASTSAGLAARVERQLSREHKGPSGGVISSPPGLSEAQMKKLRDTVGRMAGDVAIAPSMPAVGQHLSGSRSGLRKDWDVSRLGAQPAPGSVSLRDSADDAMLNAAGIPPGLSASQDGTAQREALRRYHLGTLTPTLRLMAEEVGRKLGPVEFRFDPYGLDVVGRASALAKLADVEGIDLARALEMTGLAAPGVVS